MRNDRLIGFMFLSLAMVAVGSTVIASKQLSGELAPFTATALRFAFAVPPFLWICRATGQRLPTLPARDWALLAIQSGLGSVGYTVFLILGLSHTSGATASVIVGSLPMVMGILAVTLFREPLTRSFLLALGISLAGVLLVTSHGAAAPDGLASGAVLGAGLVFLAVVCEAVFMLLNKKLSVPLPAMVQATAMSVFGLLIALVPAGYEVAGGSLAALDAGALASVVYYAVVPTLVGSTLWYAGSQRTSATDAALATAIMPIAALVLSILILGETAGTAELVGCLLIVVAILVGLPRSAGAPAAGGAKS